VYTCRFEEIHDGTDIDEEDDDDVHVITQPGTMSILEDDIGDSVDDIGDQVEILEV